MLEDDVKEVEELRSFGYLEVMGKNLYYILSTIKCQQNIDTLCHSVYDPKETLSLGNIMLNEKSKSPEGYI